MDSVGETNDQVEYVLLEIPSKPDYLFNESSITISGLQTSQPKMTVGRKHLTGEYQEVMGTALVFEKHEERPEVDSTTAVFGSLPDPITARKQPAGQVSVKYFTKTTKQIVFK